MKKIKKSNWQKYINGDIIHIAHAEQKIELFNMIQAMEKYSSGWRGAPAKGVDGSRRARVQIPLSPLTVLRLKKLEKKFLTNNKVCDNLLKLSKRTENLEKRNFQENEKSSWQVRKDVII